MKLTPEEHANRLALYHQGMTDQAISDETGVSRITITKWRQRYHLPVVIKRKPKPVRIPRQHIPMEQVLTPDQCQIMRQFFADLLTVADHGRVDVGRFMTIYRDGNMIAKEG